MMRRTLTQVQIALMILSISACAHATELKNIANVEGVRNNQLLGYGLVIGLEGSGDSQQTKFTPQSLANMLEKQGIMVPADSLKVKNVAAVIVTATLPPFARPGSTIDVVVSSLGDANSLQGGTLVQTPLVAGNGQVYAVAQGPVTIGGFSAGGGRRIGRQEPFHGRQSPRWGHCRAGNQDQPDRQRHGQYHPEPQRFYHGFTRGGGH